MTEIERIMERWAVVAEISELVQPTATGHLRTTVRVLLDLLRRHEQSLPDRDRTALELIHPQRWQTDWLRENDW